jgi:NTE family protein
MPASVDRRVFLSVAATALAAGAGSAAKASTERHFAIALGGGAARGLAHIPILEALDELGATPYMIAGTSMGAIIGAAYASGLSGRDIREFARELLSSRLGTIRRLFPENAASWTSVFSLGNSAVLDAETLMATTLPEAVPASFSDLKIPMRIVTADFYRQEEFVISTGPLHRAIGASAALPVLLAPVEWEGRVLIDGGFVNPTPFDILSDQDGPVVAVDVTGNGNDSLGPVPGALDTWIGSSQIALHSLVNERLKRIQPDLLIRPNVGEFGSMEFHRIDEILAVGEAQKEMTKRELGRLLDSRG